jgi:hypothetical protein
MDASCLKHFHVLAVLCTQYWINGGWVDLTATTTDMWGLEPQSI